MLACRSRDTKPETAVRSIVHRMGLRYRVDARPVRGLRRTGDLVFTRARVVVFIDGCFWHGCPLHFTAPRSNRDYWLEKAEYNRARDRNTDATLSADGWFVVRIWEHEAPTDAASRIRDAVERKTSPGYAESTDG